MNFLRNHVYTNINTDCFLYHHYNIYFEKSGEQIIRAYEADKKEKRKHIVSTIGEFYEREILINSNPLNYDTCQAVSMITGETREVATERLVFKNQFVDSCGMASHYSSEEVIWKAYKEFFERQSFISSVLYERPAIELDISGEKELYEFDIYLKNYLNHIKYYNISLSPELAVVLCIGYAEGRKAAGLGTSRNLVKATGKAQREMLQYFATATSKNSKIHQTVDVEQRDSYHQKFEELSVEEFLWFYDYLNQSKQRKVVAEDGIQTAEKQEIILGNYEKWEMEPYVVMFEGRENTGIKVVKILDFQWFPHMRPQLYEKGLIERIGSKYEWNAKKEIQWLPFA